MSHEYRGTSAQDRDAVATVLDKAHLLPARGEHVGANAHLGPPIQRNWDGRGLVPLGWSSFLGHRNDTSDEPVVWLPEPETQTKLARLTAQEQALLAAARAATEPHVPDNTAAKEART